MVWQLVFLVPSPYIVFVVPLLVHPMSFECIDENLRSCLEVCVYFLHS